RLLQSGGFQLGEERHEADERERPDAETDPAEEIEDAGQGGQEQPSHEAPSCNMAAHGGAAQPDFESSRADRARTPPVGRAALAGVAGDAGRRRSVRARNTLVRTAA